MREISFLIISLFYAINSCVQSAPSPRKVTDSEFAKSSNFYAAIVNNAFEKSGMEICPKIYASASPPSTEDISSHLISFDSDTAKQLETCCSSNIQCDNEKRSALHGIAIENNLRHCDCERKFRECLSAVNVPSALWWGDFYFRHTPKCYSIDHPIVECEQYKCFYQPKKLYKHPKRHRRGAVRCVKYKLNRTKPKIYQTVELPFYYAAYDSDGYEFLETLTKIYERHHN